MGAQETAVMKIVLDARQANEELVRTRASAHALGGGLDGITKGLDQIGGKAGADARQALGSLSFAFGGTAGQAAGLVDTVGDLAGALSGGPFTLALTAAGAAIGGLTAAWLDSKKAAEEAQRASIAGVQSLVERAQSARDAAVLALGEAAGLTRERQELGQLEAVLADAQRNLAEVDEMAIVREEGAGFTAASSIAEDRRAKLRDQIEDLRTTIAQVKPLIAEAEQARRGTEALSRLAADGGGRGAVAARPEAAGESPEDVATRVTKMMEARERAAEESARRQEEMVTRAIGEGIRARQGIRDRELDDIKARAEHATMIARARADREVEIAKEAAEKIKENWRTFDGEVAAIGSGIFSGAVGATTGFITSMIEAHGELERARLGESQEAVMRAEETKKQAFVITAAHALASTGEQLVGLGVKQVFEGGGMVLASGGANPAGWALAALGATAIGVGVGMGAGGGALGQGATTAIASAGARGASLDDARREAEKERGVNRGSSSSGGSGGDGAAPVTVVFNYGSFGPSSTQMAKDAQRVFAISRRRGLSDSGHRL